MDLEPVVLIIHLFLALAIIGLVLAQRSEGGGLGIGGNSSGGAGNFASARGTANFLTRATAICAALFFVTSLTLGVMAGSGTANQQGILDALDENPAPIEAPLDSENTSTTDGTDETVNEDVVEETEQEEQTQTQEETDELPSAPIAE